MCDQWCNLEIYSLTWWTSVSQISSNVLILCGFQINFWSKLELSWIILLCRMTALIRHNRGCFTQVIPISHGDYWCNNHLLPKVKAIFSCCFSFCTSTPHQKEVLKQKKWITMFHQRYLWWFELCMWTEDEHQGFDHHAHSFVTNIASPWFRFQQNNLL